MFARLFVMIAAAVLCATPMAAQTHGQLLERAIFAEDTAGDLDGAIRIYEQLVHASGVRPEILARAEARLSDARQRRALTMVAAANAADQGRRGQPGQIDPPPAAPRQVPQATEPQPKPVFADMYDAARPVTVVGAVTQVQWSNPNVVVYLKDADGKAWGFVLGPPDILAHAGWTRNSIQVGERLRAEGSLARGVGTNCPAPLPNGCATFPNGAVHANGRQLLRVDADGNPLRPADQPNPGQNAGGRGGRGGRGGGVQ